MVATTPERDRANVESQAEAQITVSNLTVGYDTNIVLDKLSFEVKHADVFVIIGASGCGKSTLMRHLIGLAEPMAGEIRFGANVLTGSSGEVRHDILRSFGVLFQSGALWSSMTLEDNVAFPIEQHTKMPQREARALARFKLALVGLGGFEDYYPSKISGGMAKRAALARAMALDPETLFLDEPSAGLDPTTARHMDDLFLELRDTLGITFVVVTHDLASIFAIGSNSIFLDADTRSILERGNPNDMRKQSTDPKIHAFLNREA